MTVPYANVANGLQKSLILASLQAL